MAKTRFQGLVCDRFKLPGASSKKPGTKMRLNLNYRGQKAKQGSWMSGSINKNNMG